MSLQEVRLHQVALFRTALLKSCRSHLAAVQTSARALVCKQGTASPRHRASVSDDDTALVETSVRSRLATVYHQMSTAVAASAIDVRLATIVMAEAQPIASRQQ